MNFNYFEQTNRFHTMYHLYEDVEKFQITDVLEFHIVEMTKLIQAWKEEKLDPWNDVLARWLLLLGMVDRKNGKFYKDIYKELKAIAVKDEKLLAAFESWEELSMDDKEFAEYEGRMKRILDEHAAIRAAELRTKKATTRRLLKMGYSVDDIVHIADLAEEQVLEVQQDLE